MPSYDEGMVDIKQAIVTENVVIPVEDGSMSAILARPKDRRPFASVIMFPHVGGLTGTMRAMARRAAAGGYLCAVPDVYHRLGTIVIDPESTNPEVVAIRRIAAASVTVNGALSDAESLMRYLGGRNEVQSEQFGTIGYGRGGSFALRAAAKFPERIAAAASILGFGFTDEPDNATSWISRMSAGVYCAFAELDDIIPSTVPETLKALLRKQPDARVVIHRAARHPYAFPDRAVYDPRAAESDWDAIFSLLARRLENHP